MRLKHLFPELEKSEGRPIASFGDARLVKSFSGTFQLIGGSGADRSHALEWISLFMHEVVPQLKRPGEEQFPQSQSGA
jgi:hypothetical protein